MTDAASELGVNSVSVSDCARGLQQQAGGFEFQPVDAPEVACSLPGEEWRETNLLILERDRESRRGDAASLSTPLFSPLCLLSLLLAEKPSIFENMHIN